MGQPSEAERVRSYLINQANKLTIPELVAKVRADTAPPRRNTDRGLESVEDASELRLPNEHR